MRPLQPREFQMSDDFWAPKVRLLVEATLPQQFEQFEKTGRIRNFQRVAAGESGGHEGLYYNDSDVYKWVEACAYALNQVPSANLKAKLEGVVTAICGAVQPDGYISTFFQLNHPDMKFRNLSYMHEIYCMGHLIEAGIAMHESLGEDQLYEVAKRVADLLVREFGESGRLGMCGHQEVEIALFRLADSAGDARYAQLARRMIDGRGQKPSVFDKEREDREAMALSPWERNYLNISGDYFQDHAPIREHRIVVGHAVRAMYMYRAACFMAEGDDALETALRSLWENMTTRRMYVTGGVGSTAKNEGFTRDFDLPNRDSYAETCAAVGLARWGAEMTRWTGESDFSDVAERAIFNGALAGLSADGESYFYANPLESFFNHERSEWFPCACCPPNIARLIPSAASMAFGISEDGSSFWIHFPIGGTISIDSKPLFEVESRYPYDSAFAIRYVGREKRLVRIHVRIPDWSDEATFECRPNPHEAEFDKGYAIFDRIWRSGDEIQVDWCAEPKWLVANPNVIECIGKVALSIGPLIYCLETYDREQPAQFFHVDVDQEVVRDGSRATVSGAQRAAAFNEQSLYAEFTNPEYDELEAQLIPYVEWANRGPSSMCVWLRTLS